VKRLHLAIGLAFVVVFLATGMVMRLRFPAAYAGDATMRMLFRSAHVYILFGALLNLALGIHLRVPERPRDRRLQLVGSLLLVAVPVLCTLAFFLEPAPGRLSRPFVVPAAAVALLGTLMHFLAHGRPAGGR